MVVLQGTCLIVLVLFFTGAFLLSLVTKTNSVVDLFWGLGFVLVAWMTLYQTALFLPRQLLTTFLVTLWGARLFGYLLFRNWGKGEDRRYAALSKKWGSYFYLQSFFKIFMLQGILLFLIAQSIILINGASDQPPLGYSDLLLCVLWSLGFIIEAVSDWQLSSFLSQRVGKAVLATGLWRYSRHPNYVGELLMWWSLWGLALAVPYGWYGIVSPLTLTVIFLFFSIPMTEAVLAENPAYEIYQKKTSVLIPWLW